MNINGKPLKKHWKYVFLLGPVLLVMGVSAGVVSGTWGTVPAGLIIAGAIASIIGLRTLIQDGSGDDPKINLWQRTTEAGTNALASTLSVLVILGLINFIGARYPLRVDLTENQRFTLAPQSQQLVRNLPKPVKVVVFDSRPRNPADVQLLDNYKRQAPSQFKYEYVDPVVSLPKAEKFQLKNRGEVYLTTVDEQRRQYVQSVGDETRLSEAKLTNALEQLTNPRTAKVYFLQGHGEHPLEGQKGALSQAVKTLKEKNFISEPLNLAEIAGVPEDATVVVVAGPQRALFEEEVKALKDYLDRGGSLLLMIDFNTNPKLDSLLNAWGVKLDERLAIDSSGSRYGPAVPIVREYGEHPITQAFGRDYSFYPLARPLETTRVEGIVQSPLLLTNQQSWAEDNPENRELGFDSQSDRPGPLMLGVALSRGGSAPSSVAPSPTPTPSASPTPIKEARMVVLGNSAFASDGLFEQQLNGDVFLNSVTWLSKQNEQLLSIRPKPTTNRRITMTPELERLVGLTALGILPLTGFGAGWILWWLRR